MPTAFDPYGRTQTGLDTFDQETRRPATESLNPATPPPQQPITPPKPDPNDWLLQPVQVSRPAAQVVEQPATQPQDDSLSPLDEATKGVARGIDQTQALLYGAAGMVGDAMGVEAIRKWGLEGYERNLQEAAQNTPRVARIEDIKGPTDFINWAFGTLGEVAPTMATMLTTGGVGGLAAKAVAKGLMTQAEKDAVEAGSRAALQKLAKATATGQLAGTAAGSVAMESGGIYGELADMGKAAPGVALGFGTAAGLLDALPILNVAQKFGFAGGLKKEVVKKLAERGLLRRVATEGGKQMVLEGSTEAIQEVIEEAAKVYMDENRNLWSDEAISQYVNALAAGALFGGVAGSIAGAPSQKDKLEQIKKDAPSEALAKEIEAAVAEKTGGAQPADEAARQAMDPSSAQVQAVTGEQVDAEQARIEAERLAQEEAIAQERLQAELDDIFSQRDQEKAREVERQKDEAFAQAEAEKARRVQSSEETDAVIEQQKKFSKEVEQEPTALGAALTQARSRAQQRLDKTNEHIARLEKKAAQKQKKGKSLSQFEQTRLEKLKAERPELERQVRLATQGVPTENSTVKQIDEAAHQAATSPKNDLPQPTEAQKKAGNYKKGKINYHGLEVSIENPKGSVRSGKDRSGKPWKTELKHHYGYINRTEGRDKDQVDVFLGNNLKSDKVYVVDQIDPETGMFDEHKVMLGYTTKQGARSAYLKNYAKGWKGVGDVTEMSIQEFKRWLKGGKRTRPVSKKLGPVKKIPNAVFEVDGVPEDKYEQTNTKALAKAKGEAEKLKARGVVGNAVYKELKTAGVGALIGKPIKSAEDVATLAQVYRNPSFETFRVVLVKDGRVVHEVGTTLRLPGVTAVAPKGKNVAGWINKLLKDSGADGFYMLHNHPSGNANPSSSDIKTTQATSKVFKDKFLGHVIIDHNQYTEIRGDGAYQLRMVDMGAKKGTPKIDHDLLGSKVRNPSHVAELGMLLQASDDVVVLIGHSRAPAETRGLMTIPRKELERPARAGAIIRRFARDTGSQTVFAYVGEKDTQNKLYARLHQQGFLRDVVYGDGRSSQVLSGVEWDKRMHFGTTTSQGKVVKEDDGYQSEQPVLEESKDTYTSDLTSEQIAIGKKAGLFGPKTKKTIKERYADVKANLGAKLIQGIFDQYHRIKLYSPTAWMKAQLIPSSSGAIEGMLTHGPVRLDKDGVLEPTEVNKGLLKELAKLEGETDRFFAWVAANRMDKLADKGLDMPLTKEEIKELKKVNKGKLKSGKDRAFVYRQVLEQFRKYHESVLDVAEKAGTISKEERATWDNEFYVPFYRVLENDKHSGPSSVAGLVKQKAYHKMKGSKKPLEDIFGNVLMNWNHLLSSALKNQAARDTILAAKKMGAAKKIPKKLKTKTSVLYRDNGKEVWYDINDPLLLQSISALSWLGFNQAGMRMMRSFKRAFTYGVTSSPEFRIANLIRDTIQVAAVAKVLPEESGNTVTKALKMAIHLPKNLFQNVLTGWRATKRDTSEMAHMRVGGAEIHFGHWFGADPEIAKAKIARLQKEGPVAHDKKSWAYIKDKVMNVVGKWEEFGSRLENINRAAAYQRALAQGKSKLEASFEARDVLDFNRHGAWPAVRILIQIVPFLNARLQGLHKLGRAWKDPNQRNQFNTIMSIYTMAAVLLYLTFKDDEDFKQREEWDKDTYLWFKLPGSEIAYRIPVPFEVGAVGTMAWRAVEQVVDNEADSELFMDRLKHLFQDTFSFSLIPQAVQPILDIYSNRDPFTGRFIEPEGLRNLPPEERKRVWTSESAIMLSQIYNTIAWESVEMSPLQMEYVVRGYLGWLGSMILGTTDQVLRPFSNRPEGPERHIRQYPAIGRFVRDLPERASKYTTQFYKQLEEINSFKAMVNSFIQLGEADKALKFYEQHKDTLQWYKTYNKLKRGLAKINKQIKRIYVSKTLSPQEKRLKIDQLQQLKNMHTRELIRARKRFEAQQRAMK